MTRAELLKLPLMERAEIAMRQAVRKELRLRRKLGLPIYISRNGKIVDISVRPIRRPRSAKSKKKGHAKTR